MGDLPNTEPTVSNPSTNSVAQTIAQNDAKNALVLQEMETLGNVFSDWMTKLNQLMAEQRKSILDLTITAIQTRGAIESTGTGDADVRSLAEDVRSHMQNSALLQSPETIGEETAPINALFTSNGEGTPTLNMDAVSAAPEIALAMLYQGTAQALANAAHNAATAQQQLNITGQAALAQAIILVSSAEPGTPTPKTPVTATTN